MASNPFVAHNGRAGDKSGDAAGGELPIRAGICLGMRDGHGRIGASAAAVGAGTL